MDKLPLDRALFCKVVVIWRKYFNYFDEVICVSYDYLHHCEATHVDLQRLATANVPYLSLKGRVYGTERLILKF